MCGVQIAQGEQFTTDVRDIIARLGDGAEKALEKALLCKMVL